MKIILDTITFWQKKRNSTVSSDQHLANLLGSNEADSSLQAIDGETRHIDLDTELFVKNNFVIAKLVIIAGLLKNDNHQRAKILRLVEPESLGENSFEGYLFSQIRESLINTGRVSPSQIGQQVYKYKPKVDGQASPSSSLEGNIFNWSLILGFEPTPAQVDKAIEIIYASVEE
jgi:hypothetical protein